MLLEKLEQESRASGRRNLLLALGFFGVTGFVVAFLLAVFVFWPTPEASTIQAEPVREDGTPVQPLLENTPEVVSETPVSAVAQERAENEIREQFKADLTLFQNDIEPDVTKPEFAAWNEPAQRALLAEKEAALDAFAQGQYADAAAKLAAVSKSASEELAARDTAFGEALGAARAAFADDNYEQASLHGARALQLQPDSKEAQDLGAGIAKLPDIRTALEKAAVARVENNLEAEAAELTAVLALDPARAAQGERLAAVRTELRERQFTARIDAGLGNVLGRKLGAARADLNAARSVYPDRRETRLLAEKIETLATALKFEQMVAGAKAAEQEDDWSAAKDFYARAGAIVPDDPNVTGGYQLATEINRLQLQLTDILDNPDRMASETVANDAAEQATKAQGIADLSPSLARMAQDVTHLVESYAQKVSIRILSDGVTRISVRGVGQVGVTTDRTIELRPGSYIFEGTRAGFRSKLITVDVPPGTEGLTLEIYPDEPV